MTTLLAGLRPLITLEKARREFPSGEGTIAVLKDLDLTIHAGEMVAIVGPSGSGTSTLMNLLGSHARPTAGSSRVPGRETATLGADTLDAQRPEHLAFLLHHY